MSCRWGKTLVLEPRRIAALAAATFVAKENGLNLGDQVGYRVRFDNKTKPNTNLIFLTEALLTRELIQNQELSSVKIVILDEFHERSLHSDLALAYLKELVELSRPDLKIVVMSATLDRERIGDFLSSNAVFHVPGQTFESTTAYLKSTQRLRIDHDYYLQTAQAIRVFVEQYGPQLKSGLIFLPGVGEIDRLRQQCDEFLSSKGFSCKSLYGQMPLEQQAEIVQGQNKRMAVFCTNVAESALTVNGVNWVVDSGLKREVLMDSETGVSKLAIARISKSSARQRAGRASRQFNGFIQKLWSPHDEISFREFDIPEIQKTDLSELVLILARLNIRDPLKFSWYEKPNSLLLAKAISELKSLHLINNDGSITPLGHETSSLALPPRLAVLWLKAKKQGLEAIAADTVALLQERDPAYDDFKPPHEGCDLTLRLEALQALRKGNSPRGFSLTRLRAIDQVARQLSSTTTYKVEADLTKLRPVLINTFADRLAKRREQNSETFLLSTGSGAILSQSSSATRAEFILALSLIDLPKQRDSLISLAVPVLHDEIMSALKGEITETNEFKFDKESKVLKKYCYQSYKSLPLDTPRTKPVLPDEIKEHFLEVVLSMREHILRNNESLHKWFERLTYYQSKSNRVILNDDQDKKAWEMACYGENKIENIADKDLVYFFEQQIDSKELKDFKSSCPVEVSLENGSVIRPVYSQTQPVFAEILLQDLFGTQKHPSILGGSVAIALHILAPNRRPVQVTGDLVAFWKSSYFEVKKELRARYPKHQWPDDPAHAKPIRLKKNL